MIVSSVVGSSIQSTNIDFKAIHRSHLNYTTKQEDVIKDIKIKMSLPIDEDSRLLSKKEKLERDGYDMYLSDSIIKDDAIDVYIANKNNKIISVGTYSGYDFNVEDIDKSIEETRRFDKIAQGFLLGVLMTLLAICSYKSCNTQKVHQNPTQKAFVQDTIKTVSKPVKNLFDKTI